MIAAAGVSRTTFYVNFDDKRDCILAAHRDAFERLVTVIMRACASKRVWPRKAAAAVSASLAFMAAEPGAGWLLTLNAVATDATVARQVIDSNAHLATLLREGRRHTPLGPALPDLTEEALIGAVGAIISGRLMDPGGRTLKELEPELLQLVLTPYMGAGGGPDRRHRHLSASSRPMRTRVSGGVVSAGA